MTGALAPDHWDDIAPAKSVWLITLADLALLLVGFFVLLHANQSLDRAQLLAAVRGGFGAGAATPVAQLEPMAVATARVDGFAPGSALADISAILPWARDVARDPRTRISITGSTGEPGDVDAATGSAAILAADRARAVAAALVREGRIDPARIVIRIEPGQRRAVTLSVGFAGDAI